MMNKLRAFTLIEVLVVVGIIGLLVSILLPSFGEVRRVSRRTACMSNLKQIGTGVSAYLSTNRDTFPVIAPLPSVEVDLAEDEDRDPRPAITVALARELGGASEVYLCPADQNTQNPDLGRPRYFDSEGTSYEWEPEINGQRIRGRTIPLFKGLVDARPEQVFITSDFEAFHGGPEKRLSLNRLYADMQVRSE